MPEPRGAGEWASPDWLLAGFEQSGDRYHFAAVERRSYSVSPFLDHRIQPMPSRTASATADAVDAALAQRPGKAAEPATWILHTAFCASTLLAACLDRPGTVLVLKEPLVLSRLAQQRRTLQQSEGGTVPSPGWMRHARRVMGLCERSYEGERVVVKPSNFANNLWPELAGEGGRRFVLMTSSLQELLVSVMKKRQEAAQLMPGFLASLLQDSDYLAQAGPLDVPQLSLMQQAAVFWHCQRHQLQRLTDSLAAERIHALTMDRFFDRPAQCLREVSAFAGLALPDGDIEAAVREKVLSRHSKSQGVAYSPQQHREEARRITREHRDELISVRDWVQPLFDRLPPKRIAQETDPGRILT